MEAFRFTSEKCQLPLGMKHGKAQGSVSDIRDAAQTMS